MGIEKLLNRDEIVLLDRIKINQSVRKYLTTGEEPESYIRTLITCLENDLRTYKGLVRGDIYQKAQDEYTETKRLYDAGDYSGIQLTFNFQGGN